MRSYRSSVSPKGQITLPIDVRRQLGIQPKDQVELTVDEGVVKVVPLRSRLDAIYRSVPALPERLRDEDIGEIAWQEHAEHVAHEGEDEE